MITLSLSAILVPFCKAAIHLTDPSLSIFYIKQPILSRTFFRQFVHFRIFHRINNFNSETRPLREKTLICKNGTAEAMPFNIELLYQAKNA
jgi:hypothetical protein